MDKPKLQSQAASSVSTIPLTKIVLKLMCTSDYFEYLPYPLSINMVPRQKLRSYIRHNIKGEKKDEFE